MADTFKGLSQFEYFDIKGFFGKKILQYISSSGQYMVNDQPAGEKVNLVICDDRTQYNKEGVSNAGVVFTVNVPFDKLPRNLKIGDYVAIDDVEKAKVWGQDRFRNRLSLTCGLKKLVPKGQQNEQKSQN